MNPRTSSIVSLLLGLLCGSVLAQDVGPVVGHVDRHTAHLLLRRGEVEGRYRLHLASETAPTVEPIEAEARAQPPEIERLNVHAVEQYRARLRIVEALQQRDDRRLARARWAHQRARATGRD